MGEREPMAMTSGQSTGIDLDHVALAVERWSDAWPLFVGALGGRWKSGGESLGFAPAQLGFSNGMRLEVLEPHQIDANDFLRRFLDRHGPGPHHLTFKVPDLRQVLEAAERAGYRPVNVDLSDPTWLEAFLHPKDGPGVVIQLAQATGSWVTLPPEGLPPEPMAGPARLLHIAHAVASLDVGLQLFAELLGGRHVLRGADEATRWAELAWPGPGRLRLLEPTSPASPVARWLAGRTGRIHHLAFACAEPAVIPGAAPSAEGVWVVPPGQPLGTRLVLTSA